MNYKGRKLDPVGFWAKYVEFPANLRVRSDDEFLPKVKCPNPQHDTLKAHFQINTRQATVHCFAHCGISGSYEHAVCVIEGLYEKFKVSDAKDERERERRSAKARRFARRLILGEAKGLASGDEIRAAIKKRPRKAASIRPADISASFDTYLPPVATEYLTARGISGNSVSKWGIGWDADSKRVVIPASDENGHLRFLIKRGITERQQPRYLYWPEKEETGWGKTDVLFGLDKLPHGVTEIVLVEGSLDCIALDQHGIHAVAILGTGISNRQIEILGRLNPKKIYLMFDKDVAGVRNIEIAAKKLKKYPLRVCRYPRGKADPAELTSKEAHRSMARALPVFTWRKNAGLDRVGIGSF